MRRLAKKKAILKRRMENMVILARMLDPKEVILKRISKYMYSHFGEEAKCTGNTDTPHAHTRPHTYHTHKNTHMNTHIVANFRIVNLCPTSPPNPRVASILQYSSKRITYFMHKLI